MNKIYPYPKPKENKKDPARPFSSQFGTGFDNNGDEILEPAQFTYPEKEFIYDAQTQKHSWQSVKYKNGHQVIKDDHLKPYIPEKELISLVRLMQIIQRPVLLKGEPGSGKTQLAKSVAYEWYGENYRQHYFEWHIKSHSKATDGLYHFDHLRRLRDVQMAKTGEEREKTNDLTQYRTIGPVGKAFLTSTEKYPSILLIDEVDKADLDFPNDLLLELDQMWFNIPETGEIIKPGFRPLIFITSNDERELPEAFLRRCLFMYTNFPNEDDLRKILKAHLPGLFTIQENYSAVALDMYKKMEADPEKKAKLTDKDFVDWGIKRFNDLREAIKNDPADSKRISTSELIDWMRACEQEMMLPDGKLKNPAEVAGLFENIPFYFQTLLKTYRGYQREKNK